MVAGIYIMLDHRARSLFVLCIISFAYELRIPCSEQFRTRDNSPQRESFRWYCTGTNCSSAPTQPLPFQVELKGNLRISKPTPLSSSSSSAPTIISYWLTDATYGTEELTISFLWLLRTDFERRSFTKLLYIFSEAKNAIQGMCHVPPWHFVLPVSRFWEWARPTLPAPNLGGKFGVSTATGVISLGRIQPAHSGKYCQ